jgi:hypothetical protein
MYYKRSVTCERILINSIRSVVPRYGTVRGETVRYMYLLKPTGQQCFSYLLRSRGPSKSCSSAAPRHISVVRVSSTLHPSMGNSISTCHPCRNALPTRHPSSALSSARLLPRLLSAQPHRRPQVYPELHMPWSADRTQILALAPLRSRASLELL